MAGPAKRFKVKPHPRPQAPPDWQKEVVRRAQNVGQELSDGLVGVAEATAAAVTEIVDLGVGILRAILGR